MPTRWVGAMTSEDDPRQSQCGAGEDRCSERGKRDGHARQQRRDEQSSQGGKPGRSGSQQQDCDGGSSQSLGLGVSRVGADLHHRGGHRRQGHEDRERDSAEAGPMACQQQRPARNPQRAEQGCVQVQRDVAIAKGKREQGEAEAVGDEGYLVKVEAVPGKGCQLSGAW